MQSISRSRILPALAALVLFAPAAAPADAQEVSKHLHEAAQRNWYVRASDDSSRIAEGRVRVSQQTFRIGNEPVPLDDIRILERRVDSGGGWKAGALIGAVPAGAFGYELAGLCEGDCDGTRLKMTLVFGGIGAIVGGIIGQIIVPADHEWRIAWSSR